MDNREIKNAILRMIYLNRENVRGQIFWHDKIASQFQIGHQEISKLLSELRHDNHIKYADGKDETETFNNEKNPILTEYGRQFVEHGGYEGRLGLEVQRHIDAVKTTRAIDRVALIGAIIAGLGVLNSSIQTCNQIRQTDINEVKLKFDTTHFQERITPQSPQTIPVYDTIYLRDTISIHDTVH